MSELIDRLLGKGECVKRSADGELVIGQRAQKIIAHYEREIDKGRMTVNTAVDCVLSDYSGSNKSGEIRK